MLWIHLLALRASKPWEIRLPQKAQEYTESESTVVIWCIGRCQLTGIVQSSHLCEHWSHPFVEFIRYVVCVLEIYFDSDWLGTAEQPIDPRCADLRKEVDALCNFRAT